MSGFRFVTRFPVYGAIVVEIESLQQLANCYWRSAKVMNELDNITRVRNSIDEVISGFWHSSTTKIENNLITCHMLKRHINGLWSYNRKGSQAILLRLNIIYLFTNEETVGNKHGNNSSGKKFHKEIVTTPNSGPYKPHKSWIISIKSVHFVCSCLILDYFFHQLMFNCVTRFFIIN
jgi:hypothetical protein